VHTVQTLRNKPAGAQREWRATPGFSLVELLVVLVIIVLVTSLVGVSINSGGREVRIESHVRTLADTAAYALDEAQFTGRDFGLLLEQVEENGEIHYAYAWRERALEGWRVPTSGKDVFATQRMPTGIALELEIENSPFSEITLDSAEESRGPQVVFYASGETTVGAINVRRMADGELLWRLEWDLLGRMDIQPRGVPQEEV